ncbi:MAG TPA: DUF2071 domain-containing protein, partial [Thermoanaerobaculia bacterium]|nr:DUF2071 domain-containing protein [Thermoanaerobaculia bacterium]
MSGDDAFHPVMRQDWRDLLFLHWQVDPAALARLVPAPLELDTHHGTAWVGLVPFRVEGLRPPLLPPLPGLSRFGEVNVRTYVRFRGSERGVWFFSLDADSRLAVAGARLLYQLPYHAAEIEMERVGDTVAFSARRRDRPGRCVCRWRIAAEEPSPAVSGSLDEFLVERYALFAAADGAIYRARVAHQPYPLLGAELLALDQDLLHQAGVEAQGPPSRVVFSPGVDTRVSRPERVFSA